MGVGWMFRVEVYLRVRRAVVVEGVSIREASRVFGLHRVPVRKMLAYSVWGWAREEATGNLCLGSRAAVQERVGNFLAGLSSIIGHFVGDVDVGNQLALPGQVDEVPTPASSIGPNFFLASMSVSPPGYSPARKRPGLTQ